MTTNSTNEQQTLLTWAYESECEEYSEQLYMCAEAEQKGEVNDQRFTQFLIHRELCPMCDTTYREIVFMLNLEANDGLLENEAQNEANEVVTSITSAASRAVLPQGMTAPIERVVEQMENGIQVIVKLASLLTQPTPIWTTRGQSEADSEDRIGGEVFVNTGESDDGVETEIHLTLTKDESDQQKLVLQAEINVPDRWPDFSGIRVVLHSADGQIRRLVTSRSGIVRFTGMSLTDLLDADVAVEVTVP